MESSQLNLYKRALIKAYYFLVIVDGKVDPKELSFGSQMIKDEEIDRDDFDDLLDSYTTQSREDLMVSLIDEVSKLAKDEQIKIIAYMLSLADADGITDVSEKDIIHDLCYELDLEFKEIVTARQNLKSI